MPRTFPTAPAAAVLRRICREQGIATTELAARLGLPHRAVRHCLESPQILAGTADRLACALGRHPSELWPDWFTERSPG
jgi:plasmid maintenance system antidote protein VapI